MGNKQGGQCRQPTDTALQLEACGWARGGEQGQGSRHFLRPWGRTESCRASPSGEQREGTVSELADAWKRWVLPCGSPLSGLAVVSFAIMVRGKQTKQNKKPPSTSMTIQKLGEHRGKNLVIQHHLLEYSRKTPLEINAKTKGDSKYYEEPQ